ncbi:MAG: redoxin family protein [Planctomycetales bacterium]|nr:redoxin family protein [Planctomycetales bacterium]
MHEKITLGLEASPANDPSSQDSNSIKTWLTIAAVVVLLPLAVTLGRWLRDSKESSTSATSDVAAEVATASGELPPAALTSNAETIDDASHDPEALSRGELVYTVYCARCHGPEGRGDGEGVEQLPSRPRDFASSEWKFPKTFESIRRVVHDGIPGTPMPAAGAAFPASDIDAVSRHVLQLASRPPSKSTAANPKKERLAEAVRASGFLPSLIRQAPTATFADTRSGNSLSLDSLRGQPVLLHFWGTTCIHCLAEFPRLIELQQSCQAAGLTILSVCADEDEESAVEAVGRRSAGEHPLYVDETGLATHRFQVQALPSYVLLDAHGRIIATRTGAIDCSPEQMLKLLNEVK